MEVFYKSETIISIIDLFKMFSQFRSKKLNSIGITYLDAYLTSILSTKTRLEYLDYYKFILENINDNSINKQELEKVVLALNSDLDESQKYQLYISLFEYANFLKNPLNRNEIRYLLNEIHLNFSLEQELIEDIESFCSHNIELISKRNNVLIICDLNKVNVRSFLAYNCSFLSGSIYAYYIQPIKAFLVRYSGSDPLTLNNHPIFTNKTYQFTIGSIIEGEFIQPIFYSDISFKIYEIKKERIELTVDRISKIYSKTNFGIQSLSFQIASGQLMAIIGGSGSGKTTLLNLLSANIKPDSGAIYINGKELETNQYLLRKHIGFVPQDDLLMEDLTVFQNLLFSTILCRDDLNFLEQKSLVAKTLEELDLFHIQHLKVGNPLNKVISGGQRKRLNIALELIRKPSIIYLDEPTSGLSSSDALSVISLLKEITHLGKIVIINIHQPSSDIFYLFDKLLILDNNGYTSYFGNPIWAANYFKRLLNFEDSVIDDNIKFGHYSPERIINLMESKRRDEKGNITSKRIYNSKDWYERLHTNIGDPPSKLPPKVTDLPLSHTIKPSIIKQFIVFTIRNFLNRIADTSYVLMLLISAPVLALMMSFFLKSTDLITHQYWFINNDNIPTYLFISVVISIFQGMVVSAGEIFRDLTILKREAFLQLSPFAYLNSKLVYLFILNAYHIGVYVLIGNTVLQIKNLNIYYFILLWITANTSSLIGLYISSKLHSILSIYITIPFILIPKILLAGAILNFDKIHHSLASDKYVPIYANLAISRWTYEGLVNIQFSLNEYDYEIYDHLIDKSSLQYQLYFVLPYLKTKINNLSKEQQGDIDISKTMVKNVFNELRTDFPVLGKELLSSKISYNDTESLLFLINKIEKWLKLSLQQINSIIENKRTKRNIDKRKYFNRQLAEFALTSSEYVNYVHKGNKLIRKYQPCYFISRSKVGRSHYYAPYKRIGSIKIETWKYNSFILIIYGLLFYFLIFYRLSKR
nr:ATP-binding cassette domain-containing protein [uncultured Carboxylicivirga sp.]